MSFGPRHYVPVLKAKRGEKAALRSIAPACRQQITPLIEVVERKNGKSLDNHLQTAFEHLAESLSTYERCFIDPRELSADGPPAISQVYQRASLAEIAFTPVTGISRLADIREALRYRAHGLAVRLTRADFESGELTARIATFLMEQSLEPGEVDLIIDLGTVEDLIVEGVAALAASFLDAVPVHHEWRTLTLSACAFPLSMGIVDRHSHDVIERSEWRAWRDHLHARRATLRRLPSFSDCAIQHPSGVEGFDPRIMAISAAIRYTLSDEWLLIKGESTRSVPPSAQFPRLATRLVYGQLSQHFAGMNHCAGCLGIKQAADGFSGYGSAEVWRRLGTIHHVSTVIQGLGSLAWP